jgi:hypothetical protein
MYIKEMINAAQSRSGASQPGMAAKSDVSIIILPGTFLVQHYIQGNDP